MVYVFADTEPDDAAVLLLMRDANEDGRFEFPGEFVAQAINGYGTSIMNVATPAAPGNYELWAWALIAGGENSHVDIDIAVMQGRQLRLVNRPRGLADGASWEMRVCAQDVGELTGPMSGMIQFSYDSPPRLFRIAVDWRPSSAPTRWSSFLPIAVYGHASRP